MADNFPPDEFRPYADPPDASPPPSPPRRDANADRSASEEPLVFEAIPVEPQADEPQTDDELVAAEAVDDDAYPLAPVAAVDAEADDIARAWSIHTDGAPKQRHSVAPRNELPGAPRRRRWPLIVGLAVGVPVGCVALVALLGWLFLASASEQPVTEKDRAVVMQAEEIAAYADGFEVQPSRAKIRKVRYLDFTHEVEYEYESADGDPNYLYVLCTVSVEHTAKDARSTFAGLTVVDEVGASLAGDLTVRPRNDLFRWGDASTLAIVESEGLPIGNIFRARSGRRIFDLTFYGVYFDDGETLAELLTPPLERMRNYEP